MNDTTVRCQNASVTEPKREKGDREAVDEVSRKKQILIRQPKAATFSRRRRLFILTTSWVRRLRSPGCSLEGMMLKLKLQYFGRLV